MLCIRCQNLYGECVDGDVLHRHAHYYIHSVQMLLFCDPNLKNLRIFCGCCFFFLDIYLKIWKRHWTLCTRQAHIDMHTSCDYRNGMVVRGGNVGDSCHMPCPCARHNIILEIYISIFSQSVWCVSSRSRAGTHIICYIQYPNTDWQHREKEPGRG